jgi:hypothetical protein
LRIACCSCKFLHDQDRFSPDVRAGKQRPVWHLYLLALIYPVVFLHMILLPINLLKLYRMQYQEAKR